MTPHEPQPSEYNPPEDRVEEPKEEQDDYEHRKEERRKRKEEAEAKIAEAQQRREEKKEERETRRTEREARHPEYTRIKREVGTRVRHGGARAERGARHVYKRTGSAVGGVLGEIKPQRKLRGEFPYGAPKVYARHTKARFKSPPSQTHQRESVNYGGSEPSGFARMLGEESSGYMKPQIDLLGNSGQRKEINLMGNKGSNSKKKIRLI
jgi:flagellar biosynthesis GTPase FlhF